MEINRSVTVINDTLCSVSNQNEIKILMLDGANYLNHIQFKVDVMTTP